MRMRRQLLLTTPTTTSTTLLLLLLVIIITTTTTVVYGNKLKTLYSDDGGQAGNMFSVVVAQKNLYILDFDIHTSIIDKYVPVQVYHKEGSFTGYERLASAWNKMGERTVLGQGKGESTNLGGLNSLFLAKGSKHSFYITLVTSCSTCSDLRFTTGTRVDALFTQNQHLRLLEGIANRYLFGRLVDGGAARVFNGAVYYTVTDTPNTPNTPSPPTSPTSPVITPPTASYKSLTSSNSFNDGQAGIMFDIVTKSHSLSITACDIYTDQTGSINVQVYSKIGTMVGSERTSTDWFRNHNSATVGKGSKSATFVGPFTTKINVSANAVKGLYITIETKCRTCSYLKYNAVGQNVGNIYAQDSNLSILVGRGKRPDFGRNAQKKAFSGALYYVGGGSVPPTSTTPPTGPTVGLPTPYPIFPPTPRPIHGKPTPTPVAPKPTTSPTAAGCSTTVPATCSNTDERCALRKIFASLNGCTWNVATGWKGNSSNYCSWYGVDCDVTQKVSRLSLINNKMRGMLPTELGILTNLTTLDLASNSLTGTLTTYIGTLTSLTSLLLEKNMLISTIPTQIGNLQYLRQIYLTSNYFTGSIPASGSICQNLKLLKSLHVDCNLVSCGCCDGTCTLSQSPSAVPSKRPTKRPTQAPFKSCNTTPQAMAVKGIYNALKNQANVNWFFGSSCLCSSTPFTGITCDVSGNVLSLNLSGRVMSGSIATHIGLLTSLTLLNLSNNAFSGSIPSEIGRLSLLQTLELQTNSLTGTFPREIGGLKAVIKFTVNNNKFSGAVPTQIGELRLVTELNLASNSFNSTIPREFGQINELQKLFIESNAFTGALPMQFGQLTNVQHLSLKKNQFKQLPTEFYQLQSMKVLDISSNSFTSSLATQIGNLNDLKYLYMQQNSFTGSLPTHIGNMNFLEIWNMSSNKLSGSLPSELGELDTINELYMQNNSFTSSLPSAALTNIGNTLLKWDISSNSLEGLIPASVTSLAVVQDLNMSNNKLSGSLPTGFNSLTAVTKLQLQSNSFIGAIPDLAALDACITFDLSQNSFTGAFPAAANIGAKTVVKNINFSSNKMSGSLPGDIKSLVELTKLQLQNNSFSSAVPDIADLVDLKTLDLSNNSFTKFAANLDALASLQKLYLQNNVALTHGVNNGVTTGNIWSLFSNTSLDTLKTVNLCGITSATALEAMTADECRYTWGTLTVTGGSAKCQCSDKGVSPDPCSSAC